MAQDPKGFCKNACREYMDKNKAFIQYLDDLLAGRFDPIWTLSRWKYIFKQVWGKGAQAKW